MKDSERKLLTDLRDALLPLHKTLLEWERKAYERLHGRKMSGGELLKVIVADPQFAWLRPVSELIVRIDEALDAEAPDTIVDVDAIVSKARRVVMPDETEGQYAQRYLAALQEVPDAVIAHGRVTTLLKDVPTRETLH
jgi:hypothetical protein